MKLPPLATINPRRRAMMVLTLALVLEGLIYWADRSWAAPVSFIPHYLVPIGLAVWYVDVRAGYVFALISSLTHLRIVGAAGAGGGAWLDFYVVFVNALVFCVFAYLVSRIHALTVKFAEQSPLDPQTGAYNRRYFFDTGAVELARAFRHKYPISIACINVEGLLHICDHRSRSDCEKLLMSIVECLRLDLRDGDTLARIGGDEFALLLPHTDLPSAQHVVGRIRESLADAVADGGAGVNLNVGGVTYLADKPILIEELLAEADKYMSSVKTEPNSVGRFAVV